MADTKILHLFASVRDKYGIFQSDSA